MANMCCRTKVTFVVFCFYFFAFFCNAQAFSAFEENEFLEPVKKVETDFGKSFIAVESDYKKSEVYINDIFQGYTPLQIDSLIPGAYVLLIKKYGLKDQKFLIEVKSGYGFYYSVNQNSKLR